jgi:hypothetical protein
MPAGSACSARAALRAAAVIAVLFGAATVASGGNVLFGTGAAAAGRTVPFIVWFNFLAGFAYVVAGVGLWREQPWAPRLALALAVLSAAAFGALAWHIAAGGAFENRTLGAMTVRTLLWAAIATLAFATFPVLRRGPAR